MKIFTQESVVKEVADSMESNLVKNAYAKQQVETSHRFHALEKLAEAAKLFESTGDIDKASKYTDLIVRLSNDGIKRDTEIKNNIVKLEKEVNKMQELYNSDIKDINKYILTSTANKITAILSDIVHTTSDIHESISNLKQGYASTPKTLEIVNAAIKVADGTMAIVLDEGEADKLDANPEEKVNLVEVLKHFGFEPGDIEGLKADVSDDGLDEDECWEK